MDNEAFQVVRKQLGEDHETATKILRLLGADKPRTEEVRVKEEVVAEKLGLHPLEVTRLLCKMVRLGLLRSR